MARSSRKMNYIYLGTFQLQPSFFYFCLSYSSSSYSSILLLTITLTCTLYVPVFCQDSSGFVRFPESNPSLLSESSTRFSSVVPCENDVFCGGDPNKYPPMNEINKIVSEALYSSNYDVYTKGFLPESKRNQSHSSFEETNVINPACSSRREKLPSHIRSKNLLGEWKYVVQRSADVIEIEICTQEGQKCKNDKDSPRGEGFTICRQNYRYERLLAVNAKGEVSVDSFPLPAACLCNSIQFSIVRNRMSFFGETLMEPVSEENFKNINCSESDISFPLNKSLVFSDEPVRFRRKTISEIVFPDEDYKYEEVLLTTKSVTPCSNGEDFCKDSEISLDESLVEGILASSFLANVSHELFTSFFSQPCIQESKYEIGLKKGALEPAESPLCTFDTEYIYPQRGKNKAGVWKHIVNTNEYQQGVTLSTCRIGTTNNSCKYDGEEGNYPELTSCRQIYTLHNMIVIDSETKNVTLDTFRIKSACVCHLETDNFM